MLRFIARRVIQGVAVLLVIATLLFFLLRLSGDPAALLLGPDATPQQVQALHHALGLDAPLPVQYGIFMANLLQLKFGQSLVSQRDALTMVWQVLPNTLILSFFSLVLGLIVALPVGIYSAVRRGSFPSFLAMILALIGQSIPSFWLGIMLILFFAVRLHWLPSFGAGDFKHLILPVVTLSVFIIARHARLIRGSMLEVMGQDYIRTARTKGLSQRLVLIRHALKNALMPVVTVLGVDISFLVSGAVIIEDVFSRPGMGRQLIDAVSSRDYPLVQATVFVIAILVVVVNLLVDVVYGFLDPRISVE